MNMNYLCDHPQIKDYHTDLATGLPKSILCSVARISSCGPDGILWEDMSIPPEHRAKWAKSCGYPHEVYEASR